MKLPSRFASLRQTPSRLLPRLPAGFARACRGNGVTPTRCVLVVTTSRHEMWLFEKSREHRAEGPFPGYQFRRRYRISTSRFGVGQKMNSNQTPLGLHCIAEKIGGGWPVGTVFRSRQPVGFTWAGCPDAAIVHRILWLQGLEPSFNSGGNVDSHARYIYIHGTGDETTLGRPASRGCVHLAAGDLIPLFDRLPSGSLIWIR